MSDHYYDLVIQKELRNLLVCYGVEKVNRNWTELVIDLEAQIKSFRKREEAVEVPTLPKLALPEPTPAPPVSPVTPPVAEAVAVPVAVETTDKKTAHKNAILKKRAELNEKKVEGRTLLTEINLKKWIAEGLTYWKIAELTGVWDAEVSALAKNYGLQSEVSKTIAFKKK
jgi:hypothetical protein